jgi:homoserine kinase
MAVDLWSEITVTRCEEFSITAEGEGAVEMPKDKTNLMCIGLEAAFKAANKPVPVVKYHVVNRIPYARGLGSSSAAIVGGIIAGLVLAGHKLPCWGSEALLQIASTIEVRNYYFHCIFQDVMFRILLLMAHTDKHHACQQNTVIYFNISRNEWK